MREFNIFDGIELPGAFTNEENLYYHRLYKMGDFSARGKLIEHNLKLVFSTVINHFGNISYEMEDLMSVGILGLIKGIDNYNEDINKKISSYFSGCIIYEVLNFFRSENKHRKKNIDLISLDDAAIFRDGLAIPYRDVLIVNNGNLEDVLIEEEIKKDNFRMINQMLDDLSDRDKLIMMLYFGFVDGKKHTQREISEVVDIDRAGVSRVIVSTLKKFKKRLLFNDKFNEVVHNGVNCRKLTF